MYNKVSKQKATFSGPFLSRGRIVGQPKGTSVGPEHNFYVHLPVRNYRDTRCAATAALDREWLRGSRSSPFILPASVYPRAHDTGDDKTTGEAVHAYLYAPRQQHGHGRRRRCGNMKGSGSLTSTTLPALKSVGWDERGVNIDHVIYYASSKFHSLLTDRYHCHISSHKKGDGGGGSFTVAPKHFDVDSQKHEVREFKHSNQFVKLH